MSSRNNYLKIFLALPMPIKVALLALGLVIFVIAAIRPKSNPTPPDEARQTISSEGYLFCFWNVENLFDDVNDRRRHPDEKYDNEYATDATVRETKLGNLSKVLLAMNEGRGPDILAVAELESERALELLQERLNADLGDRAKPYVHRLFIPQAQGRHIAPGILTRLPIDGDEKRRVGASHHRTLEGHIVLGDKQLVVVASHWTSRVNRPGSTDETHNEAGRKKYADAIHSRYRELSHTNPKIDFLVCGDFNDDPTDESVTRHLRGEADRTRLASSPDPLLFNLAANRDPEKYGTLNHDNRWHLFDQVLVAPGLLDDEGWTCDPASFRTERSKMENRSGRPWPFNEDWKGHRTYDKLYEGPRGFADHFPVTARLKVKE